MHILLAILGSVASILFYLSMLSRSGVRIKIPDPFAWNRKRKWLQTHNADPMMSISSPMEATALLMYAAARSSGDLSREQKVFLKENFQSEFHLSDLQATELLSSCSFLLKDEDNIVNNLEKFMAASIGKFNQDQKESALDLVKKTAHCEGHISEKQKEFLQKIENFFFPPSQEQKKWA